MEFLIDRKFWNLVIKKLSPSTALDLKKYLKIYKGIGPRIKKDCVIKLVPIKNVISFGNVLGQCQNSSYTFLDLDKVREIEKGILKVLIETQGLSEKIKYKRDRFASKKPEFVIEQQKPITIEEKGFVYLIRNDDIYKIGITDNLLRRFNQLKPDEVLNVVRCSNFESLEKELHKKFKEFRIPQTEYFRLSKNQIEQVNIEMTKGANF